MHRAQLVGAVMFAMTLMVAVSPAMAAGPDFFADPAPGRVLDTESQLALGFLKEAQGCLVSGQLETAANWAARGLQLDPACPDLLLLQGRLQWRMGKPAWQAISSVRSALGSSRWIQGRFSDAFLELIDLLCDTHDFTTARREIDSRFFERDLLRDPRLAARAVHVLYGLGQREAARALADKTLGLWPDDIGLVAAVLESGTVPAATANRWFDRFRSAGQDYRRALFWYVHSLAPSQERLKRCQEYLQAGGGDRMVFAWGLESALLQAPPSGPATEKTWIEGFADSLPDLDVEAACALAALVKDPANQELLRRSISERTVTAYRDYDHDGLAEERMTVRGGQVTSWTIDTRQDRLPDLQLVWRDGQIIQAIQRTRDQVVMATFTAYPELGRLAVDDAQGRREYDLPHRRAELQFIELPEQGLGHLLDAAASLKINEDNISLSPGRFLKIAVSMVRYPAAGQAGQTAIEEVLLQSGLALASREDTDGDGIFDHLVWYENGIPVLGFRDIENNGGFNTFEVFRNGQLGEVQHIDPRQGFRYRYEPGRSLGQWDLNHDGLMDVTEMRDTNKHLLQSFSSKLDGKFDITAEDGIIRSVVLPSWSDGKGKK